MGVFPFKRKNSSKRATALTHFIGKTRAMSNICTIFALAKQNTVAVEIKKSKKADLERSRLTGFFLGLAISASIFITALEFNSGAPTTQEADKPLDHLVKDLSIPAVDEQDREASHPETSLRNEITSPVESDEPVAQQEAADATEQATKASEAQTGQSDQQFASVREAEKTEEATPEPTEKTVTAPPAPLDPVEPAKATATNLPVPPGGWAAFNKWMGETLKYPKQAEKQKIKGELVLAFIVLPDGSVTNITIAKPAHELLNQEALRVAALMGKWKPGYKNHQPCKTYMELPITFNL